VTLGERLGHYEKLLRLDRPIGILLLLWPTLWGLWIAGEGWPDAKTVLVFLLGTVLMRSAGCAVNDFADRNFDPHVSRTKERPLAAGNISAREALILAAALALIAFLLILPFGPLVVALSVVAALLAGTYPFTKRFFPIPQAYLGLAFGFGIPMAFAALTGTVPALAWVLLITNVFWSIAYDTEYAMVDRDDDLKIGVRTAAITFGRFDVAAVMASHAIFLGLLTAVGAALGRGTLWFAGLVMAGCLAAYQYRLIHDRDPGRCFKAFLHNNWVGAAVFAGIALDYLVHD
jgi:4-hydroxybenzoate polyprenyltransferase